MQNKESKAKKREKRKEKERKRSKAKQGKGKKREIKRRKRIVKARRQLHLQFQNVPVGTYYINEGHDVLAVHRYNTFLILRASSWLQKLPLTL